MSILTFIAEKADKVKRVQVVNATCTECMKNKNMAGCQCPSTHKDPYHPHCLIVHQALAKM